MNLEVAQKNKKKKKKKISQHPNLHQGVHFLFSFQVLVAASHKSVILKAYKKEIFRYIFQQKIVNLAY